MKYEFVMFFNFYAVLKMYFFEVATFFLSKFLSNLLIFSVIVCIYKNHDFYEAFFVFANVDMLTEKIYFSYFHGNL